MFTQALASGALFDGVHPDEVSAFVNQHIGSHRLQMLVGSQTGASLSYREFAGLGLSRIRYGSNVRIKSPALEEIFHLQIVTRGACSWRNGEGRLCMQRGDALMVNPGEPIDLEYSTDCEKLIIKIPELLFGSNQLAGRFRTAAEIPRFGRQVVKLSDSPTLLNLLQTVFLELDETDEDGINLLSYPYQEILLRKILSVFPSDLMSMDCLVGRSRAIDVLTRYIEENVKMDIALEELANVSNMSVRSIYNAFAKSFSTTPRYYVKEVKLRKLRDDLLRGRCRNVTEIALEYGFSHLGRFSSDYRKLFGELPSETLRLAG